VIADPLADLPAPPSVRFSRAVDLSQGSLTINPAEYSHIIVSGTGKLTMNPGIYIITGGGFSVSSQGTVTGTGVMIYNAGSNFPRAGGDFGRIALSGHGKVMLTAPTTGAYAGVLIFQSRDNPRTLSLSGFSLLGFVSTIYAPDAGASMTDQGSIQSSLIVKSLTMTGTSFVNQPPVDAAIAHNRRPVPIGASSLLFNGAGRARRTALELQANSVPLTNNAVNRELMSIPTPGRECPISVERPSLRQGGMRSDRSFEDRLMVLDRVYADMAFALDSPDLLPSEGGRERRQPV
jgi:hypothetical protein